MADPTVPIRQSPLPPSPNGARHSPAYCAACGLPSSTGAFCQHCGTPSLDNGFRADEGQAEAAASDRRTSRRYGRGLLAGVAVAAAVFLVGATVGIVALLGHTTNHGPSFATQADHILVPVLANNAELASAVEALNSGGNSPVVRSALTTAEGATEAAQRALETLETPKSQAALALQIKAALISEFAWLQTASAVMSSVSNPLVSQLSGLGVDAQTKIEALSANVPAAASTPFPSSTQIVTYASATVAKTAAVAQATAAKSAARSAAKARAAAAAAAVKAAHTQATAANTQYSSQVLGLLNESVSSRQAISTFYQQLQTVVDGGTADFTLPQFEQQITSIVANRTSLAAAAQALNAPDPAAQAVSTDLTTAFNASLADDTDLDNCLNQQNDGTEAFIFQGCLSTSTADAATATADKQTFLDAYNQFRAKVGQAPINLEF